MYVKYIQYIRHCGLKRQGKNWKDETIADYKKEISCACTILCIYKQKHMMKFRAQ